MNPDAIIDAAEWRELPAPTGPTTAEAYHGTVSKPDGQSQGYVITVVAFDIEPQGHPPGSLGYDGAIGGPGGVLRLTRAQAERAFKLAKSAD